MSEKARAVLSPSIFWIFSVAGSLLLALYGYLRMDFAVVAGQLVSYYIYLWNLRIKRVPLPAAVYALLMLIPVTALCGILANSEVFVRDFFQRDDLPLGLLLFGMAGQLLFTLRFVYQWLYSSRIGRSELPPGFWWLSLVGATLIFTYGIIRVDIVLMLGQGFGLLVYSRNLWIGHKQRESA